MQQHGSAGGVGVLTADRAQDGLMFQHSHLPQLLEIGITALFTIDPGTRNHRTPQLGNDIGEISVARGLSDQLVETQVRLDATVVVGQ